MKFTLSAAATVAIDINGPLLGSGATIASPRTMPWS